MCMSYRCIYMYICTSLAHFSSQACLSIEKSCNITSAAVYTPFTAEVEVEVEAEVEVV